MVKAATDFLAFLSQAARQPMTGPSMKVFAAAAASMILLGFGSATSAQTADQAEPRARGGGVRCDSGRQLSHPACRGDRPRARRLEACQVRDPSAAPSRECEILRRRVAGAAVAGLGLKGRRTL